MKIESQYLKTNKGLEIEIRSIKEDEAEEVIEVIKKITSQTGDFLLRDLEEVTFTVESEKEWIKNHLTEEKAYVLGVYVDGHYIGNSELRQMAKLNKMKHRAEIGIAFLDEYTNKGIGTTILNYQIEQAKRLGYEILQLSVVSRNEKAIHTYKKVGFNECGRIEKAFKYKDGSYADDIIMEMFL